MLETIAEFTKRVQALTINDKVYLVCFSLQHVSDLACYNMIRLNYCLRTFEY